MKKIVFSLALIAGIVMSVNAQVRFGVNAGVSLGTFKSEEDGESMTTDSRLGVVIGATAEIPISESFRFRPGLQFVQRGGQEKEEFGGFEFKTSIILNYLDVPLDFIYKASAGNGKFFFGAGPSLGFGLSGKYKEEEDGDEYEEDINFGDGEEEIKPFHLGGNILAGYELGNGVYIQANYNLGLSNLSNLEGVKGKANYFGIRLGYNFGGSK
jgi:hypothetical protein